MYSSSGRLFSASRTSGYRWPSGANILGCMAHGGDIQGSDSKLEGSLRSWHWYSEGETQWPKCFHVKKPIFHRIQNIFVLEGIFDIIDSAMPSIFQSRLLGAQFWGRLPPGLSEKDRFHWTATGFGTRGPMEESMLSISHIWSLTNSLQRANWSPACGKDLPKVMREISGRSGSCLKDPPRFVCIIFPIPIWHGVQVHDPALACYTETDFLGFDLWHIVRISTQNLSSSPGV